MGMSGLLAVKEQLVSSTHAYEVPITMLDSRSNAHRVTSFCFSFSVFPTPASSLSV